MPFQRAGGDLPQVILQATQLFLQTSQSNRRAQMQMVQFEEQRKQWEEKVKLDNDVLKLREEEHNLKLQQERRLQQGADAKQKAIERGLDIKEALGIANLDMAERRMSLDEALGNKRLEIAGKKLEYAAGQSEKDAYELRRKKLHAVEEDAALRTDAPLKFQAYSDTSALLRYKQQRQASLDKATQNFVDPNTPELQSTRTELGEIEAEILERAKFKRNHLNDAGISVTMAQARNNLPDLVAAPGSQPTETSVPDQGPPAPTSGSTSSFDTDNDEVLTKSILSAVGLDTTFSGPVANDYLQKEHQRLKASPGGTDAAYKFRMNVYRKIPGATKAERIQRYQSLKLQ